jgi:glycerol-3-phosphate dehydrogenase
MIHVSPIGLLAIAGGKWTTYCAMAEETVGKVAKAFGLEDRTTNGCVTEPVRLVGSDAWTRSMFIGLIQKVRALEPTFPSTASEVLTIFEHDLDIEVARHLSISYGGRA